MNEDWTPVCDVDDIPVLGARRVRRERGLEVALFRASDERVFALLDRCPHKGGPLSQGLVHGHAVACPLHGWNIALDSGQAQGPDHGCTPRFAVKVEHGHVFLRRSELDQLGLDLERPVAGPASKRCREHA